MIDQIKLFSVKHILPRYLEILYHLPKYMHTIIIENGKQTTDTTAMY